MSASGVSPARKRLFFVLACVVVGFLLVSAIAPHGGAKGMFRWSDDFLGFQELALGALGAGLGLLIGLFLTLRRGPTNPGRPGAQAGSGPSDAKRSWLHARRKRDAPKRFGKRGR